MQLEYVGVSGAHDVSYDLEILPLISAQLAMHNFMVFETTKTNSGINTTESIYLLEEIRERPGKLRVTYFTQVNSEDDARNKIKRFTSLKTMLAQSDRAIKVVGNLAEIQVKAKAIAADGDISVVSEDEDESQEDNDIASVHGDIEPTEADSNIEVAKNIVTARGPVAEGDQVSAPAQNAEPMIEEETPGCNEPIEEDLTTPEAILYIDEVNNWEDRFTRANYNEEQRNLVKQCLVKKEDWLRFCSEGPWEVTETNKKENYEISQCTSEINKLPCMKSCGILPFPIMQVFACLHDSRYRPKYDENIEAAGVLSKVAANTYFIYQKTKSMMMVSSRDLVLAHHVSHV